MKNIKTYLSTLVCLILTLSFTSCLTDNFIPPLTGTLNQTAEVLVYLEARGDFANSDLAPGFVTAIEVYTNLGNYLLVDLRDSLTYASGFIEGAVNVNNKNLFNFVDAAQAQQFSKIVLITEDGQASAYYVCLLRLAGFNNVYTLKFGMASWNSDFASIWYNAVGDHSEILQKFTNATYEKYEFGNLPNIIFDDPEEDLEGAVLKRIKELITEGFVYNLNYSELINIPANGYLICYGSQALYYANRNGIFAGMGHPIETRSYLDAPHFDFRSNKFLQTLPADQTILIYSYTGQLSASITAHLRILGYNARTLLYGANSLFYSRMISDPELKENAFTSFQVNDFEYGVIP